MLDSSQSLGASHFGDKVTSVAIAALPLMFRLETDDVWQRLMLAVCGAAGSVIAIVADRPANWQETAGRIASGFIACALFVPWLARRYSFNDQIDSLIAAAALTGIIFWYGMGSAVRFLKWIKTSDIISEILRRRVDPNGQFPFSPPAVVPKPEAPPVVPVTPAPATVVDKPEPPK